MSWESEITLLERILVKFHFPLLVTECDRLPELEADFGLRRFLGLEDEYRNDVHTMLREGRQRTLYRLEDGFECHYILLLLPGEPQQAMVAGPYLTNEVSRVTLLQRSERLGVPPWLTRRMTDYYANLPVIGEDSALHNVFTAFAEGIWGTDFEIVDVRHDRESSSGLVFPDQGGREPELLLMDMQLVERRYIFENELMEIVSRGQRHRAELMMGSFGELSLEERTPDPLRNTKNYCIICNTLMRKAAEQGGVHPVYIDELSSDFARRIESVRRLPEARQLIPDMAQAYCRLVRKHKAEKYSPLVRKAVLLIETDLSRDLSLHALSGILSVSPGYLSTIFRHDTGQTLTEFVNERRLELGARLLRGGTLQIQTISQYCGMTDVNYFSKLFKKHYGVTPREYRKSGQ
ncbi:MAG: helix-turn-helix domain-containing protein [Oscillospiraceae bacterium]|nr:helix-turn-helix domain-containing protein [Oscillospiraceae bacterium]